MPEEGVEGCRISLPLHSPHHNSCFLFSHSLSPSYFSCFLFSFLLWCFGLPKGFLPFLSIVLSSDLPILIHLEQGHFVWGKDTDFGMQPELSAPLCNFPKSMQWSWIVFVLFALRMAPIYLIVEMSLLAEDDSG